MEEAKIKRSLQLTRELGAATIVQFFPWAYAEPQPGAYSWFHADRIIRHAQRQGIRVIARLGLVPAWARPSSRNSIRQPRSTTCPRNPLKPSPAMPPHSPPATATPYDAIIIWNEPNLSFEWGYRPVDPAAYTRLLRASYIEIKAANPERASPRRRPRPNAGEPAGSSAGLNEFDYLRAMYEAGASRIL